MFAASKTASVSGGYQISRSLRFNSADSAYLNRTPASTTNRRTFTFSAWVKFSKTSDDPFLMGAGSGGQIWIYGEKIRVRLNGSPDYYYDTAAVFRDYSAWYHIVVGVDTTNATSTDRVKIYVNGTQQTIGASSAPPQNFDTEFNLASTVNNIGQWPSGGQRLNGYMTEVNFIDGQALTPSSFGETNAQTGVWQPKAYSGSYGTNGFYLNFSDNSNTTAATLGKDYSGNGNNWTPNNFSVTAGAGNDSLVDSPTSYGTDTGVGGTVRGNYCTLNPLDKSTSGGSTSNGNLDYAATQSSWDMIRSTFGMSSGKWYWEVSVNSSSFGITGIAQSSVVLQSNYFSSGLCLGYNSANGDKYSGTGGSTTYGASWNASGDICGVAFDADAGTLTFYKNGVSQGVAYTGLSGTYFPAHTLYLSGSTATINFGQRPFAYTAPSGYKALCTQNLPTPTIGATTATTANKYFDISLWTGNGSSQTITNSGSFQPDFVWTKGRSNADSNVVVNAIAGANQFLVTESTQAEATSSALVSAFTSSGFSIGSSTSINRSSSTYVGWQWKANGSGSTNTAGSITSTVSANTTSGFSVVTYSGNGSNSTVGHGLGVAPKFIILKQRNQVDNWLVYSESIGADNFLRLNTTGASTAGSPWQSTTPTSSVVYLGSGSTSQSGTNYVMYCFAEVAGYSKFGSYTGNGSTDGPFVYTGFRPAFIIRKISSSTGDWITFDVLRDTYNVSSKRLNPNLSDAEATPGNNIDILSNGWKERNSDGYSNGSGQTYIYMAFASNPFKYSLAR